MNPQTKAVLISLGALCCFVFIMGLTLRIELSRADLSGNSSESEFPQSVMLISVLLLCYPFVTVLFTLVGWHVLKVSDDRRRRRAREEDSLLPSTQTPQ